MRVDSALEALAEQQTQLVLRMDTLTQQMGDIQALVRSNRDILAAKQHPPELE